MRHHNVPYMKDLPDLLDAAGIQICRCFKGAQPDHVRKVKVVSRVR